MQTLVLSHEISEKTPTYRNEGKVSVRQHRSIKKGDSSNVLKLSFSTHTSTHVDMPLHFVAGGKSLTDFKPDEWMFQSVFLKVLDIQPGDEITKDHFKNTPVRRDVDFLILKTGLEECRGSHDYIFKSPVLSAETAKWITTKFPKLRAIGFDYISLSSQLAREEGRKTHKVFLGKNILIVEDMKLDEMTSTPHSLLLSPLWVGKADGAPVTVWAFYHQFSLDSVDAVFFDFDGVILDSNRIKENAYYEMYESYGKKIAKKVLAYHRAHGGISRFEKFKYWHKEYLGVSLSPLEVNKMAKQFSTLVFSAVVKAPFIPGVEAFLKACKKAGKVCFVVSGTPDDEMKKIVSKRKLGSYFKTVKGSPKKKAKLIRELLTQQKVDRKRSIFFGDSIEDLNAANETSIPFIGINGVQSVNQYKNFQSLL